MDAQRGAAIHRLGPYRALSFQFEVRCSDAVLADYLGRVFTDLEDDRADSCHMYTFLDRGTDTDDRYALWFGEDRIASTPFAHAALSGLLWHVNRQAVSATTDRILLHASAVEANGVVAMFPAPMESGKTTLVAGLLERFALRYLTDEATALNPDTGVVEAFPKPLTVDEGAWEVLAGLRPHWPDGLERYVRRQWHVPASAIRPNCVAMQGTPGLIIAPRYDPREVTRLEPASRAETLILLAEQAFNLRSFGFAGVEVLAEVVGSSQCYSLPLSDLDEACRLVSGLLEGVSGVPVSHLEVG